MIVNNLVKEGGCKEILRKEIERYESNAKFVQAMQVKKRREMAYNSLSKFKIFIYYYYI